MSQHKSAPFKVAVKYDRIVIISNHEHIELRKVQSPYQSLVQKGRLSIFLCGPVAVWVHCVHFEGCKDGVSSSSRLPSIAPFNLRLNYLWAKHKDRTPMAGSNPSPHARPSSVTDCHLTPGSPAEPPRSLSPSSSVGCCSPPESSNISMPFPLAHTSLNSQSSPTVHGQQPPRPGPTVVPVNASLERWTKGPSYRSLHKELQQLGTDPLDVQYLMDMIRLNPEANMEWADRTKALANVVLEAVQAEQAATSKQLERTKMVVDLISRRLQYLDDQLQAALRDKVLIDMVHKTMADKGQHGA